MASSISSVNRREGGGGGGKLFPLRLRTEQNGGKSDGILPSSTFLTFKEGRGKEDALSLQY